MKNSVEKKGSYEVGYIPGFIKKNCEVISINNKEYKSIKKIEIEKIGDNNDLIIGNTIKLYIDGKKINKMITDIVIKIEKDSDDYYIHTKNGYVLRYDEEKDIEGEEKKDEELLSIVGKASGFVNNILSLKDFIKKLFIPEGEINDIDRINSTENIFGNMSNDELKDLLEELIENREKFIKELSRKLGKEIPIFEKILYILDKKNEIADGRIFVLKEDDGDLKFGKYTEFNNNLLLEEGNSKYNNIIWLEKGDFKSKDEKEIFNIISLTTEIIMKLKKKIT